MKQHLQLNGKLSEDLSKTIAKSRTYQTELQDKRRENQDLINSNRDKVRLQISLDVLKSS